MDPASIVQIIGTAVSLGDVVLKCISRLHSLKSKYHDAPLIISTITGQLYMVQAALDQLGAWSKRDHGRDPRYQQLALHIGNFLDCFSPLILTLEQRLEDFEPNSPNRISMKQKFIFLWGEKETSEYSSLLDRQVNALNLLLQAVQCNTWAQQQHVMCREESQRILEQAKYASSSMIALEDTSSFISENTGAISMMFDFDVVLLASKIYQRVGRSHLRQVIRAKQPSLFGQGRKDDQSGSRPRTVSLKMKGSSHRVPLNSPQCQQQGYGVATPKAKNLSSTNRETSQEQQYPVTSDSSSNQTGIRRTPSTPSFEYDNAGSNGEAPDEHGNRRTIVILGASETGKSTLFKVLKLAKEGYSTEERLKFKEIIWSNAISNIRVLLKFMEFLKISLENKENEHYAQLVMRADVYEATPQEATSRAISSLWLDRGIQHAYQLRTNRFLCDSTLYYATAINRLTQRDYMPSITDILWSRQKTTGLNKTSFPCQHSGIEYCLLDVGGAPSEKRNWGHAYKSAISIIFTVDTTSYSELLLEDEVINKMQEELSLFESIVNDRWLARYSFIIVFTKMDLLEEYLRREPVQRCFPDYIYESSTTGPVKHYMEYLEHRFLSLIQTYEVLSRTRTFQLDQGLVNAGPRQGMEIIRTLNELLELNPEKRTLNELNPEGRFFGG